MAIPSNLIPVNTSEISGSIQSLAGQLPVVDVVEIPEAGILSRAIPDSLFTSASFDQIREQGVVLAENYIQPLQVSRPTFSIPTTVPTFSPKLPSFGQIKNYINTKIDRIKRQKQQASIKALRDEITQKENPFTYRQSLINKQQRAAVQKRITNQ